MNARARLAALGALALGASCTTKGDGLILVQISSGQPLSNVRVLVTAPANQSVLGMATADWPQTPPLKLGVYVPKSVSGAVDLIACGFDGSGNLIAATPNDPTSIIASAQPGATSAIVDIALTPGSAPPLCGSVGMGGHGGGSGPGTGGSTGGSIGGSSTGGTSGTSGTGGTGGTSGTGGASGTGGTGGTGGASGTGDASGTGGAGATAGSSAGGTTGGAGGTSGSGGSAGSGGRGGTGGGTGGSAGSGGRGGTGGSSGTGGSAGAGGRGGSGGTGGTGGTGGSGGSSTGGTGGGTPMWRGEASVSTVAGTQTSPSVAVDPNGNAVVVYMQGAQIYASRYSASSGNWGPAGVIDSRGGAQNKPSVAVDKNGNYLAIWNLQTGSAMQGVWQSTSSDGMQWSTPKSITQTIAVSPVLAMNPNGAAIVAWEDQLACGNCYMQAMASIRSAPGVDWTPPQVLLTGDDSADRNPAVAVAGNGNAWVAWEQSDAQAGGTDNYTSLWMRQYTAGTGGGWNAAGLFESYMDESSYDVSIAANANGDAIVTYIQISNTNPATVQVWSRRYSMVSGSFATNPLKVFDASSIDTLVAPSVTLDDAGNATVAFAVQTGTGYQVQVSRTSPTDPAWPTPTGMETDDTAKNNDPNSTLGYVTMPVLSTDPAGNVTLVWRKRTTASGTRFDLVSRRYSGGSWGAQVPLETNTTNSVFWPVLAVGANGTAVAAWYYANSLDVWANVFH